MEPRRFAAACALGALLASAGCSKDVVLPGTAASAECHDGVLEPGEECDVESAGCVDCRIAPDWTCSATSCAQICGDGVVGAGAACDAPRRDAACDMSGWWAVRAADYTRDAIVSAVQSSSNWFLYRFTQTGDDFVASEFLDCGVHVTGSATVDYTPASLRAVLTRDREDAPPHGPRHGTSKPSGGGCAITFDRFYKVRGCTESAYLPVDFASKPPLSSLTPIPAAHDPVSGGESPAGAEDWDGDGIPGIAFDIGGFVGGVRNSAQRDWKEYATPSTSPVPTSAVTFTIPGAFDLQDDVLRVTQCGTACALLASAAHAAQDIPAKLQFFFVGRSLGGPRTSRVVVAPPHQSVDTDLSTCANVRLLLPHDPSTP